MNVLSAEGLSKSYDDRWLFRGLTIGLSQGDKVALVGANGTGKTTLMRVLTGMIPPDDGVVALRRGIRLTYLEQQPSPDLTLTVGQVVLGEDNPVAAAYGAYERALADPDGTTPEALEAILAAVEEHNAWDFESRAAEVLGVMGLEDRSQPVGTLSGGQRKRVALARLVLSDPDVVLLDEPTNHLDLAAIEWLEGFLRSSRQTVIMVTHDRYFLDNVTTRILELDGGQLHAYEGNYGYFLEKKAERLAIAQAGVDKARNLYTRELEWIRRQPKARGTKARYRVDAFEEIKKAAHQDLTRKSIELDVQTTRQGNVVLELSDLSKRHGSQVLLEGFGYTFRKGDRVGLIGRNGVGKSTFLDIIMGRQQADAGTIRWGQTTRPGYYTQETDNLDPERRLIDEVKAIAEYMTLADGTQVSVSKLLEMFLFPPAQQYGYIGKLSGGERRRLQLLKVLVSSPNFLILDEPTNDLDLDTLAVLEQFLDGFGGCLVLVSHDRYFMDRLVDHLFVFEGQGRIRDFPGNYTDYRTYLDEERDAAAKGRGDAPAPRPVREEVQTRVAPPPAVAVTATATRKLSFKEQRELAQLETDMPRLEGERARLIEAMGEAAGDFPRLKKLGEQLTTLEAELSRATDRWLTLSE